MCVKDLKINMTTPALIERFTIVSLVYAVFLARLRRHESTVNTRCHLYILMKSLRILNTNSRRTLHTVDAVLKASVDPGSVLPQLLPQPLQRPIHCSGAVELTHIEPISEPIICHDVSSPCQFVAPVCQRYAPNPRDSLNRGALVVPVPHSHIRTVPRVLTPICIVLSL